MLIAKNLSKSVAIADDTIAILRGIDLEIKQGESIAIVGASGSGKSTLLGLLAGLDLPSSGTIMHDSRAIHSLSEDERAQWRGQFVGFIFQSFQLLPSLTTLDNVCLPLQLAGSRDAQERARAELAKVGLEHRLSHYPKQLSGGEQQRVAIARAFVTQPSILFADEPTGNLDEKTGEQITELLFEMTQTQGKTLVLVTHDPRLAARCQSAVTIRQGQLEARA